MLYEAAEDLQHPAAEEAIRQAYADEEDGVNGFNMGILCCIPKGSGELDEQHGQVYEVSQTRPLSLVDVSNRMVAAAYKHRWERT